MKLKKASIYLISFLILCFMFSACYYLSYLHALNSFNKKAIERKEQLSELTQKQEPTPGLSQEGEDSAQVEQSEATVLPSTQYTLQVYDMKTDTTDTQELNPPAYLVGLTRQEIIDYLDAYMNDMPLSEINKGLISYELEYFSKDEIIIKKTYDEDFVPFRFYVAVKDGYVIVYNSDMKSIFEYTHIEAKNLPEEDRIRLNQGIYLNSLDDVYSLLESYSS